MAAVLGGTHREGPAGAEGGAAWLPGCCGGRGAPHTLTARGRSFTPTRCSPMQPQGQRLAAHPSVRAGVWASGDPSGRGSEGRLGVPCGMSGWGPCVSQDSRHNQGSPARRVPGSLGLDRLGQEVQEEGWAQRCRAVTSHRSPGSQASGPHQLLPWAPRIHRPSLEVLSLTPLPFPEPGRPAQPAVLWGLSLPAFG